MDRLLGELIGLARATEGNEHLITPAVTAVVIRCLAAAEQPEEKLESLLAEVEEEKRNMVPNCFCCASPCGRNNAFDLQKLREEPVDIQTKKRQILEGLQALATDGSETPADIFCTGLIAVGIEGIDPKFLDGILANIQR